MTSFLTTAGSWVHVSPYKYSPQWCDDVEYSRTPDKRPPQNKAVKKDITGGSFMRGTIVHQAVSMETINMKLPFTRKQQYWHSGELIGSQKASHKPNNKDQSPTVTLTWHLNKYTVRTLCQRCLCDSYQALINSLVCGFCTGILTDHYHYQHFQNLKVFDGLRILVLLWTFWNMQVTTDSGARVASSHPANSAGMSEPKKWQSNRKEPTNGENQQTVLQLKTGLA